jgi:hypothetical protein
MKILLPILILLYTLMVGFRNEDSEPLGKEPATGFIDITVESNVNHLLFTYALTEMCLSETGANLPGSNIDISTARIIVPVKDFKCSNQLVYKDFLTLLKASQYPYITIAIPQKVLLQYRTGNSVTLNNVLINIAGVTKRYDITCVIENRDKTDSILIGSIKIRLTDLKIEPPVKYLGLVKVKDEVIVKFGFCLKDSGLALNKN